jgi:hypothetical protein
MVWLSSFVMVDRLDVRRLAVPERYSGDFTMVPLLSSCGTEFAVIDVSFLTQTLNRIGAVSKKIE